MYPIPLTVYGSSTCEDTALVRDRLRALGIPFSGDDREENSELDPLLASWNNGNLVTPTLLLSGSGGTERVLSEPALERLDDELRAAGFQFESPRAVAIRDERKDRRAPEFTLPSTDGQTLSLHRLRGRKRPVLFFAHSHACRVCQGYARQLTDRRALFEEYNAVPLLILPNDLDSARSWANEFARGYPALSDAGGQCKQAYASYLDAEPSGVFLVVLDSFAAPRAVSAAPDAGGLIAPGEAMAWLRLIDCECDE